MKVQWGASSWAEREFRVTVIGSDRDRLEAALVDRLDALLDEVGLGLTEYWPDYAEFLESDRSGITDAAMLFVRRLVEMSRALTDGDDRHAGDETVHLVFEQIGRQQQQEGVDLVRLLTAFQYGARVAWRHVAAVALDLDLAPESLALLADAVFVFVNQLSFSTTRGYLQAQLDDSRERERHREELAELLLSGRASDAAIHRAAVRCGWRIPDKAAAVLVDAEDAAARRVLDQLGPDALPIRRPDLYGAIVPDPDGPGRRTELARRLVGAHAVVGYAVPLDRLPRSTEVAHTAAELRGAGVIEGDPVFAEEHLDTIIVWRDRGLIDALAQQALAPLAQLTPDTRERLTETLAAWLHHQGDHRAMARELSIHPQTVRYRMHQLHDVFGDALEDPRSRARLFLALAWRG